jgi:hypothetical protein
MTASVRAVLLPRPRLTGALVSLWLALGGAAAAHAAPGPSPYAAGLHVPAGGIVAPDNRVWVSDHNGGFCRLSPPDDRGPGTLDHPSLPGAPSAVARTCIGGLLPDAAPGPDAAGQPAFSDPTPEFAGSGDEIVLIPDGAASSMAVWRAHWNPHTQLFEADPATDVISMDADAGEPRPRPTAVSVAPDGDAYVVFQRSSSIQRIVEPDAAAPRVELVGFTSDGVGTTAVAAGYGPLGPMGPPTVYVAEGAGIRQIAGARGDAGTTTSASPFSAGTIAGAPVTVSTLAYRATDVIGGQGTLYAGTADAAPPLVLPGPDSLLRLQAGGAPATLATGFSTVGGLAIRPADGSLFVFDDPAIAIDGEPLGRGRAFVLGEPFTQILAGPTTPAGRPALHPDHTADTTPTFTYAGEFARQCSLTPATAAANDWRSCGDTTYTAAGPVAGGLADGRYRFAVRSVNGSQQGPADTRYFTVDTVAPTATPVIVNPRHDSQHLRSPRFAFDSDDPNEPEFGYQCKIDDAEYAACEEGAASTSLADGPHTLQIRLVDGAGNVGAEESDSTPDVADDPQTVDVDESAGTTGAQPAAFTVGQDPATSETDPTTYAQLTHPTSASLYGDGLHVSTGALEDPAGRVWVTDHNGGFCRMTDPTIDGAGRIDHPELPDQPRSQARTCLGGLLPEAGPGADAAGPPTFVDPTPKKPGNGDEVVLIADGFAQSNYLVRLRWDPGTELFEYLDQVLVPAVDRPQQDRARPVTTQIGPDPDGIDGPRQPSVFFVNKRDGYVGRVDDPAGDPSVHVAGFVSPGGDRAEVLAIGQRDEVVTAATETDPAVVEKHPVVYLVDQNGLARLDDPRIEGEDDAPATLQAASMTIPGVADATSSAGAMAYDLQRDLLYIGTANGLVPTDVGIDRFVRWDPHGADGQGAVVSDTPGFSMVGGIGLRNDGRILVVDDRALLDPAEPLGEGLMFQIGSPAARVTSGPSDPESNALDPSYTSGRTPSFGLAGDAPRECWVRPESSTAAPDWRACDGATYTTPSLGDGTYKLTVRATGGSTAGNVGDTSRYVPRTVRFTVDTVGPARPRVTSVKPLAADNVTSAEPFFAFEGEAGVQYSCRLNATTYNKVPCRPGRSFPRAGTPVVRNGANTLVIRSTDKAGNTSQESQAFTFQADATVPTVTISSPAEGQVTGTEARFVFRASQVAATQYGCRLDGATFKRCDRSSDAGGPGRPYAIENLADGSIAVTYRGLGVGEHHFQVHASDDHGNVSPNASRNIRVDTSAPVALVDAPAPNATTGTSTTLVSHIDPTTIGAGETNSLACTLTRGTTPVALPECDGSIPVSGLLDGVHTFTVRATDSAGNAGPVSSRSWTVDGTPAVITIGQQGNGVFATPTFTITTNEPATLQCRYDTRPVEDCATVNGRNLGSGQHTLHVVATDAFGNVSQAARSFSLVFASSANTSVPTSITQTALRAGGLPVTFTATETTALARFVISRVVEGPALATAARAAKSRRRARKIAYKPLVTVKRLTPKAGVYRRRLNERTVVKAMRPGLYRVETRLKDRAGTYGEPVYNTVRVKQGKAKATSRKR